MRSSAPRQRRADARRNHEVILAAARRLFAARGLVVPIDEVARQARVGAGTIYRHFPSKEDLYEAVLVEDFEAIVARAKTLAGEPSGSGVALFDFLAEMAEVGSEKMQLAEALARAGIDFKSKLAPQLDELRSALAVLLRLAQEEGTARPDLDVDILMALVSCCCQVATSLGWNKSGGAGLARLLRTVFDGIRTAQPSRTGG
jgi:AcrR family transcriptional regulator